MGKAANEIHRKSRAALIKEGYDAGWSDARVKSIPLDDEVLVELVERAEQFIIDGRVTYELRDAVSAMRARMEG